MESADSISLVDNTVPQQPSGPESPRRTSTVGGQGSLTKHSSRASAPGRRAKRKYAKWQPGKLGVTTTNDTETSPSRESSRVRGSISGTSSVAGPSTCLTVSENGKESGPREGAEDVKAVDFAPSRDLSRTDTYQSTGPNQQTIDTKDSKPRSELDILYENQRGSFFFGIPLYSHSSLLNFDPSAWTTQDGRDSAVNITNAQVPDPSWEWVWRAWYVDMSRDVDEQGWQYSFSFGSSQWHGTHPWFHSFVRRRRWVRLRTKVHDRRSRGRSDFERSHMLNEDYFTIHSSKMTSREQSMAGLSRVESGPLSRVTTKVDEEAHSEEIGDIPSLMHELKLATIDRERIDALKKFVQEGGEELYYLNDKIPEIMSMFLFQASRWQFVIHVAGIIHQLSEQITESDDNTDEIKRKKDNLIRAIESAKLHITGPEIFTDEHGQSAMDLLDLTPASRHNVLLSKREQATDQPSHVLKGKEITGIPREARVGREWHIH